MIALHLHPKKQGRPTKYKFIRYHLNYQLAQYDKSVELKHRKKKEIKPHFQDSLESWKSLAAKLNKIQMYTRLLEPPSPSQAFMELFTKNKFIQVNTRVLSYSPELVKCLLNLR